MLRPRTLLAVCLLVAGAVLGWVFVVDDTDARRRSKEAEAAKLEAEVEAIEAENDQLRARVEALGLEEGPAVEEAIREELGFVKQDELVLRLPGGDDK